MKLLKSLFFHELNESLVHRLPKGKSQDDDIEVTDDEDDERDEKKKQKPKVRRK